jgi:hypothetical protein
VWSTQEVKQSPLSLKTIHFFDKVFLPFVSYHCAEILFMPQFTWHNVFSTADSDTHMNVAVNLWLTGDLKYKQIFEALHAMLVGEEPEQDEEGDEEEDD